MAVLDITRSASLQEPGLLLQAELASRWRLSVRTLEKWRSTARGPRHLKLGRRVYYRLEDIEAYEASHLRGEGVR